VLLLPFLIDQCTAAFYYVVLVKHKLTICNTYGECVNLYHIGT
jgi:hypothetical protein